MSEINLANKIPAQLPAELVCFMREAGGLAAERGQRLYLVGGVVRDLLLGRANLDLDLVVEGDAVSLSEEMARRLQGKIVAHQRFGTARVRWNGWSADLATARRESYARPGALPGVQPGSIGEDLARRDFTVNAMAVSLNPDGYGGLIDRHGGRDDIELKLIRVLHQNSFIDDATRIWRGLRYEQRLGFRLEEATLAWLKRDIPMLDTISGDRIRRELELVLQEEHPEKALRRAAGLGVLDRLHPALRGDGWLAEKFRRARRLSAFEPPSKWLYLALLAYRLTGEEIEDLIKYLRLPGVAAGALRDTAGVKARLDELSAPAFANSRIYAILAGYRPEALMANLLAADDALARERIRLFLDRLRRVKPSLTGEDLKGMGVPQGARIREILERLRAARLDVEVKTKREEEEMVEGWGLRNPSPLPPSFTKGRGKK